MMRLGDADCIITLKFYTCQIFKYLTYNGPDHGKTEKNCGHLIFGPLENRRYQTELQNVWYSNLFSMPMLGIQAPTVELIV